MSQISPPIRIVLVAAVAFLAAWMLVLRPKTEEIPPPAPAATAPAKQQGNTAQSAAGQVVQAATNAAATAESAAKARAGETAAPTASTAPATATASKPAAKTTAETLGVSPAALASLPRGVRSAIEARKIVVLAFFNPEALDDRATEKQLAKVHRFHGRASVHTASIKSVQRYQVITRGVDVTQTPSVVVIDRNMKAQLLTGYVDHLAVEQAIVDAMRRSDMPVVKTAYLREVNALCGTYADNAFVAIEPGIGANPRSYVRDNTRSIDRFLARVRAVPAPKASRSYKAALVGDLKLASEAYHALLAAVEAKSGKRILAVVDKYDKPMAKAGNDFNKRARQHDMLACMYG